MARKAQTIVDGAPEELEQLLIRMRSLADSASLDTVDSLLRLAGLDADAGRRIGSIAIDFNCLSLQHAPGQYTIVIQLEKGAPSSWQFLHLWPEPPELSVERVAMLALTERLFGTNTLSRSPSGNGAWVSYDGARLLNILFDYQKGQDDKLIFAGVQLVRGGVSGNCDGDLRSSL